MFNEEETLTFVYDEYVDVEVPKIIQNPYAIARSTGSTRSKLDRNAAYTIHLQNQKSLNSTFEFLNLSTFWILRHSLNIRYFIIINEKNFEDLQKTFTFLWSLKIHKIVVFTQHYSKKRNIIKIHTSNPFYKGNHCGTIANVIHSQDCSDNSTIQILEKYKNLNGCDIIFLTPALNEPSCGVTYLLEFFNELADTVNGNFTAKFSINKTTAASIQMQAIIAVTLRTDQSELFLTNDISNTAFMVKFEFVVKGGEPISPVKILFIIFKTEVWIMIIVSILVASIALWFITSFDDKQFIFSKLKEICSNVLLATIWGYFAKMPKNKGRYICICYLMYQLHIQTGFTSNLVTVLTTPQYKPGITNIEQLLNSDLSIIAAEVCKEYYFSDIDKPDSIYSRIKNRTRFAELDYNEKAQALHSGNNALFLFELDTNFIEANLGGSIHINRIKANSVAGILRSSYLMTPGHYFKKTLNSFLRSRDESGITQKNLKKMYDQAAVPPRIKKLVALNLKHLFCAFVFLAFGLTIASVVFIMEVVATYENEQLEKCVSKTINEMFNEEETLTFVYDEYVDVEVPKIIQNPYAIARSTGSTRSKLDKNAAYIMHLQNQKSLNSTFEFLNLSTFWILRHSLNIRYFIIINEQNFKDLQKTFTFLWSLKIHKIVVFTQHYSKNRNIIKIHTSNPFYKRNYCGTIANVIHSQDCSDNNTIQILEKYKNLNGCDIIFLTPTLNEPSADLIYLSEFFNELADTVNGNFTAKFLINTTTAASIQKQPIIALTLITDQSALFLTNDFSNTAFMVKLEFVVKGGEPISPVKILFIIFKTEVWIMIIVSILVTSIALWFITSFDDKQFIFSKLEEICSNVLLATIWGYFAKIPKNKGRYICICYLIYQMHIQTGFTFNLVAVLTTPQYKPGITNIEQLLNSDLSIIAAGICKEYYFSDIGKPGSIYSRIKNRTRFAELEYNEKAEALHSGNNALFLLDFDTNFMEANLGGRIHINRIKANSVAGILRSSYLMTPGHYFKKTLNSFLRSRDESGITQKNLKKMYDQAAVPPRIKKLVALNLKHLFCAFVFLAFGLTIASVVFIIEVVASKY
ncbi:hypothetical protein RN001_003898 [Aquatica leii]|uniref:Ionotropic glutamate receptor C-terminal domain-containing protein n=1 Tax=Aquatica leii TaxID=1421715 RepID=A0AAN7SL26_9COLE|nr:hypothetical protein RN001_003898 [Aquatica leii]